MREFTPILACGNIFTPFQVAVIVSVFVGWLASLVLSIVNPCLFFFLSIDARSKFTHFLLWTLYVGTGFVVWETAFAERESPAWLLIPIFAFPILAVSHFVTLLLMGRRVRLKKQTTNDP